MHSCICMYAYYQNLNIYVYRRGTQESTYDERIIQSTAIQAYVLIISFLCEIAVKEIKESDMAANIATDKKRGSKTTSSADWSWVGGVLGKLLRSIGVASEIDLEALFAPHSVPHEMLQCISNTVVKLLGLSSAVKAVGVKEAAGAALGAVALRHGELESIAVSLAHLAQSHEHAVPAVAVVSSIAEQKWNDSRLVTALLQEIAAIDTSANAQVDSAGVKNMATLAIELAERTPHSVASSFGILLHHFSGTSPSMRSGLISAVGNLVVRAYGNRSDESDNDDIAHDMGASDAMKAKLRTKQGLLNLLIARARDSSAFTRARVLQTWTYLAANKCIPLGHWNCVSQIARSRMSDKAAIVRRAAMQLLSALLEFNPFGPELSANTFANTLNECEAKLPTEPEDCDNVNSKEWQSSAIPEEEDDDNNEEEDIKPAVASGVTGLEGGVEALRALVASLRTAHEFTVLLSESIDVLSKLLQSGTASDVTESISLLVLLSQFGVDNAESGARQMLPLVFSSDIAARDAVIGALERLYLSDDPANGARKLADVAAYSSTGEAASLEEVIRMMASRQKGQAGALDIRIMKTVLNDAIGIAKRRSTSSDEDGSDSSNTYGSLLLLSMITSARPELLRDRVNHIINSSVLNATGLAKGDMSIKSALHAIRNCTLRTLQDDNSLFNILEIIIRTGGENCVLNERVWYAVAEEAMAVIYSLHPDPEAHASKILLKMLKDIFESTGSTNLQQVNAISLSRLLSMTGIVAVRQLVHIEKTAKKIRADNLRKNDSKKAKDEQNDNGDDDDEEDIAAQVGGGDAASFDLHVDSVREAVEREIVGSKSSGIIASLSPLVEAVCEKIAKDSNAFSEHATLQSSAALALSRLMAVDEVCCQRCLPVLFTILRQAPSPILRSNCIIAVGDLAFRYPNLLEPWTEHIYAPLNDKSTNESVIVRRSCVMVLSHLILNDMMKVKGYISDLAICMEDPDDVVASQARLFMHELAKRTGNPIYNLLPDIISRLSSTDSSLAPDSFQRIMKNLISYVDKEKLQEGLLSKLCSRLGAAESMEQRRNLAFCIAQLQVSEKMLGRLTDQFQTYKSALLDAQVQQHILSFVGRGKKLSKPEVREIAANLEGQILAKAEDALCVENEDSNVKTSDDQDGGETEEDKDVDSEEEKSSE